MKWYFGLSFVVVVQKVQTLHKRFKYPHGYARSLRSVLHSYGAIFPPKF